MKYIPDFSVFKLLVFLSLFKKKKIVSSKLVNIYGLFLWLEKKNSFIMESEKCL